MMRTERPRAARRAQARREAGIILVVVLFFALLLSSTIAVFIRRVSVDATVARNRDAAQQAEALARGGARLAEAIVLEDLRVKAQQPGPASLYDVWARVGELDLVDDPDVSLQIEIRDATATINLNGFLGPDGVSEESTQFLQTLLTRVIDAMPGRPEDKLYDPTELVENLIDWLDADDVRQSGGPEDDVYQRRDPPYRAANGPLFSVDELRLVEGFDAKLVEALRPYVGVYPLVGGGGLNVNTAPLWVLAQLNHGNTAADLRPVEEEDVRHMQEVRDSGRICDLEGADCIPASELRLGPQTQPPLVWTSNVFRVRARARVGDVERTVETVIDRTVPAELLRLSWRVE